MKTTSSTILHGLTSMTCRGCVARVARALGAISGVEHVEVSLETRSAHVLHDPSVEPKRLVAALEAAGYGTHVPPTTSELPTAPASEGASR